MKIITDAKMREIEELRARCRAAEEQLARGAITVTVQREFMENSRYLSGFNQDDTHPLWAGMMELLHRLECVQIKDSDRLTPDQIVTRLDLLDEIREQMVKNRRESIRDAQRKK